MKNFLKTGLLAAAALVAFSSLASAAQIQCSLEQNVRETTAVYNCPGLGVLAGNTFTNITVTATLAWSDTTPFANIPSYHYVVAGQGSAPFNFSVAKDQVCVVCSTADGNVGLGNLSSGNLGNFASIVAFNVNVTGSTNPGNTTPQNASASIFLNYTVTPDQTGVPEPMTMSLMGAGLLALGFAGRKFRRS